MWGGADRHSGHSDNIIDHSGDHSCPVHLGSLAGSDWQHHQGKDTVTAVILVQATVFLLIYYCTITTRIPAVLELLLLIDTIGFLNEFKLVKSLSPDGRRECCES